MENDASKIIMDDLMAEGGATFNYLSQKDMRTAGGWAMLMAILGSISVCIFTLSGASIIFMSQTMGDIGATSSLQGMGILFILVSLLFVAPIIYLFLFAIRAIKAYNIEGANEIHELIGSLKNFFMSFGIVSILSVILFIIWSMYMASQAPGIN